jgi:hypothetical protein
LLDKIEMEDAPLSLYRNANHVHRTRPPRRQPATQG